MKQGSVAIYALLMGVFVSFSVIAKPLTEYTLQLKWQHQFQFAGYYVAKEQGFYEQAGLDVTIKAAPQSEQVALNAVLSGEADFGISNSGLLKSKVEGADVVALAALFQSSPYCWMVAQQSDIFSVDDFAGKKLAKSSSDTQSELELMLNAAGVDAYVKIAPLEQSLQRFKQGRMDALEVYLTNEPFYFQQQGFEHRLVCPNRYGYDVYGDILFTSSELVNSDPQNVNAFYQASLKGWQHALAHPEQTIALIQAKYNSRATTAQLEYEAAKITELVANNGSSIGMMTDVRWRIIGNLYGIDPKELDEHIDEFIYQPQVSKHNDFVWLILLALVIAALSIPLYIRLLTHKDRVIFDKKKTNK